MSGHCKKCFGVYGDHKAGCPHRRPATPSAQPQAWVLLDDRVAAFQQEQSQPQGEDA